MSPAEICRIDKPSKRFAKILEETEQRKGEPYEQQEVEGHHPQHEKEFREQVHRFRESSGVKSPGSTSRVKNGWTLDRGGVSYELGKHGSTSDNGRGWQVQQESDRIVGGGMNWLPAGSKLIPPGIPTGRS